MTAMTRQVRIQLWVFAIIGALAVSVVAFRYLELPRVIGLGQTEVTLKAHNATGIHERVVVSMRGVTVGRVTDVRLTSDGASATLRLDDEANVPRGASAAVHSASAVGEQYIDLLPRDSGPPYLTDGDVIPADRVTPLLSTEEMVSNLTNLARSVDGRDVDTVLTELTAAFGGTRSDWHTLINASRDLVEAAQQDLPATSKLITELEQALGTQHDIAPDAALAVERLDRVSGTVVQGRQDLSGLLEAGAPLAEELGALISESSGDLALILHDMVSVGEVVKTYLPGVEQILVLYPPTIAALQAATSPIGGAGDGEVHLELRPTVEQPPTCFKGFLPIKNQRSFHDLKQRPDIPDDLYCRVPHDDPRAVRGARNSPCMNVPGRRAASVEQCLGHRIGTIREPLSKPRKIATYDPASGRALTDSNSKLFLSGVGAGDTNDKKEIDGWQSLVLR